MTPNFIHDLEPLFCAFFAPPNLLSWANRASGPQSLVFSQHVDPWLELYARRPEQAPLVLPRYTSSGLTELYAGAATPQVGFALTEELQAFLGNTYACFMPHEPLLHCADKIDEAFNALCPALAYRINCAGQFDEGHLWRIIGEYRMLHGDRPDATGRESRPFGRIQHDLDEAIQVGDEGLARFLLNELHLTGRLNATNKKFLEIKILAGMGRWATITDTPVLRDVVEGLATPINVHGAVLTAIYRRYFGELEVKNDLDQALKLYRDGVGGRFATTLATRRGIRSADVVKLFLLREVASGNPNGDVCKRLAADLPDAERQTAFVCGIIARVESIITPQQSLSRAKIAFDEGRYESVVKIVEGLTPTPEALTLLLEAASDEGSAELAVRALDVLDSCSDDARAQLTPRVIAKAQRLRVVAGSIGSERQLRDWSDWCRVVEEGKDEKIVVALAGDHLSRGDWVQADFALGLDRVAYFAEWIVSNDRREVVETLFPQMCAYHCYGAFRVEFRPIYESLFQHAVLQGDIGTSRLQNIYELVRCMFEAGVNTGTYVDVVGGLRVLLESTGGIAHLDWRLDVAELLAVYPCLDDNARSTFASEMVSRLGEYAHRILPSQWAQLDMFAVDYGLVDHISKNRLARQEVVLENVATDARKIAIYSLLDGVARRAGEVLQRVVGGLRVETNSDKVATDRLRSLAASADFLAFAWLTASHPAYDCVRKSIRSEDRLLLPQGKGSSSIVRCVLDALGTQ